MSEVGQFFDQQAAEYASRDPGMRVFHEVTARKIEAGISGDVLCVGGLWARAQPPDNSNIVVVDVSRAMLETWAKQGLETVQADARELPFSAASFDHIVLPLMLHHIAGKSVSEAQLQAGRVLSEVKRVLRPAGEVWISEFCVSPTVYALERTVAPVTRRVLALRRIPLVVMHSKDFYREALEAHGFGDITIQAVVAPKARGWDTITPVIALPWLKVPRVLYPLTPTLIHAIRKD